MSKLKLVALLPVVAVLALAPSPADAQRRAGSPGAAGRAAPRAVPRTAPAPRAGAPVARPPVAGAAPYRNAPYRYYAPPRYGLGYSYGYPWGYYRPYGFGFSYGYPGPYYGNRFSFGFSYGYPGGYGYAPYWYGFGYPAYGYGGYAGPGYGYVGAAPGQAYGGVRLDLPQRSAEVYADGYFVGTVDDFDGTFQQVNLEPGPHRIAIRAPGYETIEFDVRIEPGQTITYRADMRRVQQ